MNHTSVDLSCRDKLNTICNKASLAKLPDALFQEPVLAASTYESATFSSKLR